MRRFLPLLLVLLIPIVAAAYVLLSDSDDNGGSQSAGPPLELTGNLIQDGGFEETDAPCSTDEGTITPCWFSLREPDWILSDKAHTGRYSALLRMRESAQSEDTKIYYLVQEFDLDPNEELPEVISGHYLVENWNRGTDKQYLQFVVILWGDDFSNLPTCPNGNACPNYQIRYLLAGIESDPFAIGNAKFVYIDREEPVEGEWVHFQRNLRDDFQEFWGAVPDQVTRIRLLFEVRYDDKQPGDSAIEGDVYYDDLYLGPAETAP